MKYSYFKRYFNDFIQVFNGFYRTLLQFNDISTISMNFCHDFVVPNIWNVFNEIFDDFGNNFVDLYDISTIFNDTSILTKFSIFSTI